MWVDDEILKQCTTNLVCSSFVPKLNIVVLGSSNKAEREALTNNCNIDGVEVLRRYGGGGTVVLYPGCVVVRIGCWVKDYYQNSKYFRLINNSISRLICDSFPLVPKLETKGISDIAYKDFKIGGTSLFRSRNYLLYQASILVNLDIPLMERYLCQPSIEPDYRKGRVHKDFMLGLNSLDPEITPQSLSIVFNEMLKSYIEGDLSSEFSPVISNHCAPLLQRTLMSESK